ncbi:MAG TPA: CAP domain-containing protein [Steroidobacteraceae bacterium]|nr:CAP domain-containing protein [Steroidobacteraceae bacterium]
MEKTPAGVLRVVLLLVVLAGCAEVATVLGEVDDTTERSERTPGPAAAREPASPAGEATGAPSPTTGSREPAALAGITAAHNRVRAQVGVPPLRWSPALAAVAHRWANACVDRDPPEGMIDHSSGRADGFAGPIGENLYATTAAVPNVTEAVAGWAEEAPHYDAATNACAGGACGHYTQLVWRATREVGCAVGTCPKLRFRSTLVCNYAPAGNIVGERPF